MLHVSTNHCYVSQNIKKTHRLDVNKADKAEAHTWAVWTSSLMRWTAWWQWSGWPITWATLSGLTPSSGKQMQSTTKSSPARMHAGYYFTFECFECKWISKRCKSLSCLQVCEQWLSRKKCWTFGWSNWNTYHSLTLNSPDWEALPGAHLTFLSAIKDRKSVV